jgi:hypothetical protein
MTIFRKLIDFYIDASLHIGLAVMSLVYVTQFSNNLGESIVYPSCVFFGTIVAYNFLKYIELIVFKKIITRKMMAIIGVTLFSFLTFLFFIFWLERSIQIKIVGAGLLVLIYPFLRKHGWLKLFLVSFVITIVTVYSTFFFRKSTEFECYITLMQRFMFITSLMIPFEIYDSQFDQQTLNTIPQRFGIRNSKLFGMLLIIPFILLEFFKENVSFAVIPIGVITVLAIHFTSLKRSNYYTSFWVESIPIFWLLLLLFLK